MILPVEKRLSKVTKGDGLRFGWDGTDVPCLKCKLYLDLSGAIIGETVEPAESARL